MASELRLVPSELELLEIEIETLWPIDDRRRLRRTPEQGGPLPLLAVGVWREERTMAIANDLAETTVTALAEIVKAGVASHDPFVAPSYLSSCVDALAVSHGPVQIAGGPSYIVPPETRSSSGAVIHSEGVGKASALLKVPPASAKWEPDEWRLLLAGNLGPWAIATVDGSIVAICHSARLAARGAEAGVWTAPAFRGQGHAAAVTAAWANLLRASGRHLFYSTSSTNLASQRVAARLNLRPIGWIWKLLPAGPV